MEITLNAVSGVLPDMLLMERTAKEFTVRLRAMRLVMEKNVTGDPTEANAMVVDAQKFLDISDLALAGC